MDLNDFLNRVASDCVNATQTPLVMCRTCDRVTFCQPFTVAEQEVRDPTADDGTVTVTTGQCDDCLQTLGADEHCDTPAEDPRTAAEVNGETELELMREWS
jgi:hypothetical protein